MQIRMVGWLMVWLVLLGLMLPGCKKEPQIEGKSMNDWLSLLRNREITVRERACDVLARHAADSVPHLRRFLSSADPTMRKSVVTTLGMIGPGAGAAIKGLLQRLAREEVAVIRAEILKALANIDPKAEGVAEEFTKRLRDEDPRVRQAAQAGLDAQNPPKKPESDLEDARATQPESYILREVVAAELEKEEIAFGLVAEVVRENRRAAIIWPGVQNDRLIESQPVGYVFEQRGEGKWIPIATKVDLTSGPERLVELLEGADKQRVVRACGVEKDMLPAHLEEQAQAFRKALAEKKPHEAMQAFEQLSKAFSFRIAAYTDTLPTWLQTGVIGKTGFKLEPDKNSDRYTLQMPWKAAMRSGEVRLTRCADGYAIAEINWTAAPKEP